MNTTSSTGQWVTTTTNVSDYTTAKASLSTTLAGIDDGILLEEVNNIKEKEYTVKREEGYKLRISTSFDSENKKSYNVEIEVPTWDNRRFTIPGFAASEIIRIISKDLEKEEKW